MAEPQPGPQGQQPQGQGQQPQGQQQPPPVIPPPALPPVPGVPKPPTLDFSNKAIEDLMFPLARYSPWAERFGNSGHSYWRIPTIHRDRRSHSGLAPEFPGLSVPLYAPSPFLPDGPPLPEPGPADIDRLLLGEEHQRLYMGVPPWQLGTLNDELHDGIHGGHNYGILRLNRYQDWEEFRAFLVKVDESTWLSNFGKAKFYDLRRTSPLMGIQIPIKELREHKDLHLGWSVDNDVLWKALSPALELANRIFLRLIEEKSEWLAAMLFAKSEPWINTDPSIAFYDKDPREVELIQFDEEASAKCDPETLRKEIELRGRDVRFGIWDETVQPDEATRLGECTRRRLNPQGQLQYRLWIHFGAGFLRPLLEEDTTVTERCYTIFQLAVTIVHEYAHALRWAPKMDRPASSEPVVKGEYIAEMGISLEAHVFRGDRIFSKPGPWLVRGQNRGIATNADVRSPHDMLAGYAYFKQSEQRTLVHYSNFWWTAYPLPAFWISAFICEKFWSEIVAKYGSKAFAPPHLFKYGYAKTLNGRQLQDEVSLVDQFESYSVSEFHELSARIRTKFWERNEEWAKHRPWRPDVPKDWYHSPWSWQERRSTIESFRYFHAMKDLDQVRRIAVHFVKQEQAFYHGALAQVPAHTIYYLLAVLMFAAIPITSSEFDPGPGIPKIRPFSLTPPPPDAKPLAVYFASSAALAANDIRAFKWPYPDTREKEPLESSDLWWSHQEALETFRQVLMLLEWQYGGSKSWLTGLIDTYSSIKAEREAKPLVTEWTSFPFLVPTFAQDWIRLPEMTDIAIPPNERYRYCDCTWAHMVPIPPYIPQAGTISAQPNLLGGHAASNVHDTTVLRHFTVGEVGNHRGLTDAWVVHPDGMFGHDVYQISDLLHANGANENDYRAMVKTGPFGPELVSGDARADYIRECFKKSLQPIGKVLQKRRPAEVVHFNGSNGAPRWVTAGPYAYDLADFPFSSHEEEQLLDKSAGGPIQMPLSAKNPVAEDLMKRLKPHLCAFIESDRQEAHLYMRQFSPRMLRWHDNPELRCYMAVGGVVYDIGDYTSFHPGGDHIMRKYMGLDATEAFLQAHSLDIMKDFEFMRVGTLVPEIEMDQINNTQVVINGSVYDISKPLTSSVELHETLKLYGGTDASGDMGEHSPGCEALRELLERPDRVVAVISEKLPDIPSGEIVKHSDPHKPEGAWVTVGDWVYNVRDLMLFPQYYEHHISQVWAGAELDDPVLSKWLEENYSARRIGRLVVGSNWPKPVLDTVMVIDTTPKCGFSSN